mgnify:FL=1
MRLCVLSLDEKISQFNIGDIDLYPIFVKKKDYAGIVANLWNGKSDLENKEEICV